MIAAILTADALAGIFSTSVYATDGGDESETNTEQKTYKEKNVGSGESFNNNGTLQSFGCCFMTIYLNVNLIKNILSKTKLPFQPTTLYYFSITK
jgi:hypothetical protein